MGGPCCCSLLLRLLLVPAPPASSCCSLPIQVSHPDTPSFLPAGPEGAAEEAADANASGDKADWEACDPRSVYQILMEQGSDFASGIASVVVRM